MVSFVFRMLRGSTPARDRDRFLLCLRHDASDVEMRLLDQANVLLWFDSADDRCWVTAEVANSTIMLPLASPASELAG